MAILFPTNENNYVVTNYLYQGMGKGWALVGDAICFKGPGMAQGIHNAIRGAQLLADNL
jgi:flavin-dependent dehydrogenase